ncbi:YqcC family protein [Pseudoalteromonas phenolica]|uniref:YqcC family protein n=1 Tax=Pseudoalteromonas phenolica TaxID=161398 RepID=UPI00110A56D7|nr:YqcC family protein [Pseudoalteromonas phenolica]TMO53260.1 hypothetical protein CWC21_20245 [Pseudoalteromonas phenolica]
MSHAQYQAVYTLLKELEAVLRIAKLWQSESIEAEKLNSSAPFCCDVMTFEQWLQFLFIPKMSLMIEQGMALPANMSIAPMAEMSLATHPQYPQILSLLTKLDESLQQN